MELMQIVYVMLVSLGWGLLLMYYILVMSISLQATNYLCSFGISRRLLWDLNHTFVGMSYYIPSLDTVNFNNIWNTSRQITIIIKLIYLNFTSKLNFPMFVEKFSFECLSQVFFCSLVEFLSLWHLIHIHSRLYLVWVYTYSIYKHFQHMALPAKSLIYIDVSYFRISSPCICRIQLLFWFHRPV